MRFNSLSHTDSCTTNLELVLGRAQAQADNVQMVNSASVRHPCRPLILALGGLCFEARQDFCIRAYEEKSDERNDDGREDFM